MRDYLTDDSETMNDDDAALLDSTFAGALDDDAAAELDGYESLRAFTDPDDDAPADDRFVGWERDDWETN